jgi:hypothetical protein
VGTVGGDERGTAKGINNALVVRDAGFPCGEEADRVGDGSIGSAVVVGDEQVVVNDRRATAELAAILCEGDQAAGGCVAALLSHQLGRVDPVDTTNDVVGLNAVAIGATPIGRGDVRVGEGAGGGVKDALCSAAERAGGTSHEGITGQSPDLLTVTLFTRFTDSVATACGVLSRGGIRCW